MTTEAIDMSPTAIAIRRLCAVDPCIVAECQLEYGHEGAHEIEPPARYEVKYYDARLSRKGRGVQVKRFTDRAAAEEFAGRNRLYAERCVVQVTP